MQEGAILTMLRGFEKADHAELYAKYRPIYPTEVVTRIIQYARSNKTDGILSHMLDVGCGSGQSTEIYAPYVENITALDVSASQIEQANKASKNDNIKYLVGSAEELPVNDNSVDLICSGLAIHWAEFEMFWTECKRVMKSDGSMVLYGYDLPQFVPHGVSNNVDDLKQRARSLTMELSRTCKFHDRIQHVNNKYKNIFDMIPCKDKYRDDSLIIERHWTLADLGKCYATWSGYQTYVREKRPDDKSPDIIRCFLDKIKVLYQREDSEDEDINLRVTWDIFILFSKRPE